LCVSNLLDEPYLNQAIDLDIQALYFASGDSANPKQETQDEPPNIFVPFSDTQLLFANYIDNLIIIGTP